MGNILFLVQNTVSVDGQNSSSKFTVWVKVRAATSKQQPQSRHLADRYRWLCDKPVWNASPSSHSFVRFSASKITERSTTRSFTSGNLLKGSQSNNASLTVPQKNGTGKTRQTIDPHGTGTALAYHATRIPTQWGKRPFRSFRTEGWRR